MFRFLLALAVIMLSGAAFAQDSDFPDLKGNIEQHIEVKSAQNPGQIIYVLLVSKNDGGYSLMVYSKTGSEIRKLSDLPNFWKGGATYNGRGDYPASIGFAAADNEFVVGVRDPSEDHMNMDLRFRWAQGRFKLIGEKKSANPKTMIRVPNSEHMVGRWTCSVDTNYLTGEVMQKLPGAFKHYIKPVKPRYLDDYVIEADYLDQICHPQT